MKALAIGWLVYLNLGLFVALDAGVGKVFTDAILAFLGVEAAILTVFSVLILLE